MSKITKILLSVLAALLLSTVALQSVYISSLMQETQQLRVENVILAQGHLDQEVKLVFLRDFYIAHDKELVILLEDMKKRKKPI